VAGLVGCLIAAARGRLGAMLRLPRAYLLGGGATFVVYMVCLYLAIGLAASRQQTLEVAVLNYLWPGLTLVLAVPILGARVRPVFYLGVAAAVAGGALAPLGGGGFSLAALGATLRANPWPYLLGALAGVLWALHSVLGRRTGGGAAGGAVPLFALASGIVLGGLRLLRPEAAHVGARTVGELAFMAVFPGLLAYGMWDRAMREGDVTLVAALAYLIPLSSTAISCAYLGVRPGAALWLACGLIVVGAAICQAAVRRA
jgi:drug/metabolite transporter (DMT)-like permease